MTVFCPQCHQRIAVSFAGVRLSPFKKELATYIKSHPGRSSLELADRFYGTVTAQTALSIRSHIYQINEELLAAGIRIHGEKYAGYTMGRSS